MAVSADGTVAGSVSGGCVEGAVYEVAREVMAGAPARVVTYGISDDEAFAVGLTCGGIIDVLVEPVAGERATLVEAVAASIAAQEPGGRRDRRRPGRGGRADGSPAAGAGPAGAGGVRVGAKLAVWPDRTLGGLGSEASTWRSPTTRAGCWSRAGPGSGYPVVPRQRRARSTTSPSSSSPSHRDRGCSCSARSTSQRRSPGSRLPRLRRDGLRRAGHLRHTGPFPRRRRGRRRLAAPLPVRHRRRRPHGHLRADPRPKFDVPLLEVALRTPAAYIGAMGSRRTHADRLARLLRERGLTDAELGRLRSPVGLDRRTDTRGDGRVDRGGDHRAAVGRHRASPRQTSGAIHSHDAVGRRP